MALGTANTLRLSGVSVPGLTSLLDVGPLGNIRRRIQVTMMGDTTGGAVRLGIVLHVQIRLADMTLPGRIGRIDFEDPTTISLNHVVGTSVHLTAEPAAELHGVLNMGQILKHYQSVTVPPGRVSDLLSNENTQFTSSVGQVSPVRSGLLRAVSPLQGGDLSLCPPDLVTQ